MVDSNDSDNIFIEDALCGILALNRNIILEDKCIILRKDHCLMKGKVKLLSGGIYGNEPAHHGYVGAGMLTAAVLGTFTSPPTVANILQALTLLGRNYPTGVLVIASNCARERMNFRTAMERARENGLRVKMVTLSYDAGMVLLHKIAGAMSENGYSLDAIYQYCSSVCTISIRTTVIPQTFMNSDSYINNIFSKKITPAQIYELLNNFCLSKLYINSNDYIVILVNNYGGCSKFDEYVFVGTVLRYFTKKCHVARTYSGTFFSVPNACGFSISVLKTSDQNTVKYLDAPTVAIGWPRSPCPGCEFEEINNISEINGMGPCISDKSVIALNYVLNCVMDAIIACSKQLDLFHAKRNIGTRLKSFAVVVKNAVNEEKLNVKYLSALLLSLSSISEEYVSGIMGNLYSAFFSSASKVFQNTENNIVNPHLWLSAFRSGTDAVYEYGEVRIGDGTMLDSLYAAVNMLEESLASNPVHPVDALSKATAAAEVAAIKTMAMQQNRKQNVDDPDPGAHAVGIWMRALYESVRLKF